LLGFASAGVALCLIILAMTSAADAAMSALSRHRLHVLQNEDAPRASIIERLLAEPYRFKAAILLLNAVATIAATSLVLYLTRPLPVGGQIGALAGLLLTILVFSESLPKALALRNPQRMAQLLSRPMEFLAGVFAPFIGITDWLTRPLIGLLSGAPAPSQPLVTEEELRMLVNVGEEEGLIEPDEREMIEGIFTFGDTLVREVMVPRMNIVALDSQTSLADAVTTIMAHGHSRIPVYADTIDRVIGILYAKDVLPRLLVGDRTTRINDMLRGAYFVPDSLKVDALLRDLQTRKVHVAIVVDEYGGTAGLVTIEDLLEEIVGEIQDEYDREEEPLQVISDDEILVGARVLLDDLNARTNLGLISDESDTIGGLVYEKLGRVPQVGDMLKLHHGITITVISVEGLGPRRLRITSPSTVVRDTEQNREEVIHGEAA
jgi:CBS domain containing-hemolysin-like protein